MDSTRRQSRAFYAVAVVGALVGAFFLVRHQWAMGAANLFVAGAAVIAARRVDRRVRAR
ncbi:MAG: hypothetical protein ABEJ89_04780 [Haloarculaceae archaeon]